MTVPPTVGVPGCRAVTKDVLLRANVRLLSVTSAVGTVGSGILLAPGAIDEELTTPLHLGHCLSM